MEPYLITLIAKWRGKNYNLDNLSPTTTIHDVKKLFEKKTQIPWARQKLVGINVKGRPAPDNIMLSELKLKNPHKFMLVGTPEADLFIDPADRDDIPEIFDDFDLECSVFSEQWRRQVDNSENLKK